MENNFRKKILNVSLFALLVCLPVMTSKVENVKAVTRDANGCYTHKNFYIFSGAHWIDANNKPTSTPEPMRTNSPFKYDLPEGTNISSNADVSYKWLNLNSSNDEGWNMSRFEQALEINRWGEQRIVKNDDAGEWIYYHDKWWANNDTGTVSEKTTNDFSTQISDQPYYYASAGDSEIQPSGPDIYYGWSTRTQTMLYIKRTYGSDWLSHVNSVTRTGWVFLPAVLRASFQVCEGANPPDPGELYDLITKYQEDGTGTTIKPDDTDRKASGDQYNITCPRRIETVSNGNYTLTGTQSYSGTMPASNKTVICKYKKEGGGDNPTSTYKILVSHYTQDGKIKLATDDSYPGYSDGDPYDMGGACKDSITYKGSVYTPIGKPVGYSGTINGSDVSLVCKYTTKSSGTADLPIFIVWGIGGAALAYSVYFFRKYYKEQNEV